MGTNSWQYLVDKYLANTISAEELDQLLQMVDKQEEYEKLTAVLKKYWAAGTGNSGIPAIDWDTKFAAMVAELHREPAIVALPEKNKSRLFYRITAAAVIVLVCSGVYVLFFQKSAKPLALTAVRQIKRDISAPASSNAILTLSNGKTIVLDSVANGSLAMQGNTKIVKLADGQIIYNGKASAQMQYNMLTVPKGSKIASITLTDGTRVWLNAQSSLKYPVAFTGTERKVDITGEVYFEVAHNASMPFIVQKDATQVTVLGTHFNINSYDDEPVIKVTLLEGAVKITKGKAAGVLKPGQQAKISAGIKTFNAVDTDEVMAWINGKFQFGEAADITSVMQQISRWYDVDIEYKGTVTGHIGGTISRSENVSQVLKMLEMTGGVTFKIDEKKVIVMPK